MGYLRDATGAVIKDPDARARGLIETIFTQFAHRGTLNGVLRYLVEHQLALPYRCLSGPQTGQLRWRRPNRVTLSNLLHNPTYAGAYVYGRRQPGRPATGARWLAPSDGRCCSRTACRPTSAGRSMSTISASSPPTGRRPAAWCAWATPCWGAPRLWSLWTDHGDAIHPQWDRVALRL
jgi:hypothetical protein